MFASIKLTNDIEKNKKTILSVLSLSEAITPVTIHDRVLEAYGKDWSLGKLYTYLDKYVEKGWTSGDQASWEKQLKTRSLGQDDYVKSK